MGLLERCFLFYFVDVSWKCMVLLCSLRGEIFGNFTGKIRVA